MAKVYVLVLIVLMAVPAQGQDMKRISYAVSAAGPIADFVSSVRFSTNGSGCLETNVLTRHADETFDIGRGLANSAITVGVVWTTLWLTGRSRHKIVRWLGRGFAFTSAGVTMHAAVYNISNCGW